MILHAGTNEHGVAEADLDLRRDVLMKAEVERHHDVEDRHHRRLVAVLAVRVLRRGPGGREPLAVQVGETLFALRLLEAQCIEVQAQGASVI